MEVWFFWHGLDLMIQNQAFSVMYPPAKNGTGCSYCKSNNFQNILIGNVLIANAWSWTCNARIHKRVTSYFSTLIWQSIYYPGFFSGLPIKKNFWQKIVLTDFKLSRFRGTWIRLIWIMNRVFLIFEVPVIKIHVSFNWLFHFHSSWY